jgi:hypothetical protein
MVPIYVHSGWRGIDLVNESCFWVRWGEKHDPTYNCWQSTTQRAFRRLGPGFRTQQTRMQIHQTVLQRFSVW